MSGLLPLSGLHLALTFRPGFGGYEGSHSFDNTRYSRASLVLLFGVIRIVTPADVPAGKGKLALCF